MLSIATTLVSLVVGPLLPIGITLLYYDLRVRKEGLDLELQANELAHDSSGMTYR